MKQALIAIVTVLSVGQFAAGAIVPVYQVTDTDATWTESPTVQGQYTVATSSEDYANEIWERPVKDNEWDDAGGTRTSTNLYWAYGDLKSGAWGVGTNADDSMDYLFVKWGVVGAFQHEVGKEKESKLLEGHYYFYAELPGEKAFAIEVPSGKDLGANFGDVAGKVNIWEEENEGDVPGGGSFANSQVKGEGRTDTATFVTEVAVKLSDLGLALADFDDPLDYIYIGIAVSNPSSVTDLFANDHFDEEQGFGQEYDTLKMANAPPEEEPPTDPPLNSSANPEPSSLVLAALAIASLGMARRRRR